MDQDVSWWTACSLRLEHVQKNEKACSLGMYRSVAWWKARSLTLDHVIKKEKFRHLAWTVFSANLFKLVRAVSRWKAGSWTWWVCESSLTYSLRTSCSDIESTLSNFCQGTFKSLADEFFTTCYAVITVCVEKLLQFTNTFLLANYYITMIKHSLFLSYDLLRVFLSFLRIMCWTIMG
jgi:uncharacterized membrane protein YwzB